MFGIFLSAINTALTFVFTKVIVKFLVIFAIFFVISAFTTVLGSFLPETSMLDGAFSNIPSGVWYFLNLFAFSSGAKLIITAYAYRFLIRRIPLIG
jgi:hypothetical protein